MTEEMIKFNACSHLDFSDNYMAEKNLISDFGETKIVWDRPVPDSSYPRLVQFCSKRGRINYATGCLREKNAMCGDYVDHVHTVALSSVNLE